MNNIRRDVWRKWDDLTFKFEVEPYEGIKLAKEKFAVSIWFRRSMDETVAIKTGVRRGVEEIVEAMHV